MKVRSDMEDISIVAHAAGRAVSRSPWLLLDHFDIDRDGDIVADQARGAGYSEIHAIDFCSRGGTHALAALRILHSGRRSVYVEDYLFGDAVNCEIAGDFELARSSGLDLLRLEGERGIFLYVEIVGATEVVVAHLDAGVQRSGFDGGLNGRLAEIGWIVLHGAGHLGKGAANGGEAEGAERVRRSAKAIAEKVRDINRGSPGSGFVGAATV